MVVVVPGRTTVKDLLCELCSVGEWTSVVVVVGVGGGVWQCDWEGRAV